jgi:MFS family permease
MINVALPSIERSLELTSIEVTWTLSGYILAFGLTLVTAGRLGDDYGRRRMFLIHSAGALCSVSAFHSGLRPSSSASGSFRGTARRVRADGSTWWARGCSDWASSRSCFR